MEALPGSRLEKVLADFAEQYGILTRARAQMNALSVTACSRDGVVEVTVGADGRASQLRFVDKRSREMAVPQLADDVLQALKTARAEASARAAAVLMSAKFRLPVPVPVVPVRNEPVVPEEMPQTPSPCWRRLVREARAVAAGSAPVRVSGVVKADSGVGAREGGTQEAAGTGVSDVPGSLPQEPLWGRTSSGTRPSSQHAPLPTELLEAVMALKDAVCDAVCDSCKPAVRPHRLAPPGTTRSGLR